MLDYPSKKVPILDLKKKKQKKKTNLCQHLVDNQDDNLLSIINAHLSLCNKLNKIFFPTFITQLYANIILMSN